MVLTLGRVAVSVMACGVKTWPKRDVHNWDAPNSAAIPIEPDYTSRRIKRRIRNELDGPATIQATVQPKGVALWMPNSGMDRNYCNVHMAVAFKVHRSSKLPGNPAIGSMDGAGFIRAWPTPGPGGARHMVTVSGFAPTTLEADLGRYETMSVWVAFTVERDATSAKFEQKLPVMKYWHGGQVSWLAIPR
jgi:hypothetical protein